ncbi:hypothetical protein L7F22_024007 [Adiantum nelumboides]|nr:hypothetical protein [Adiantum nelumboides]
MSAVVLGRWRWPKRRLLEASIQSFTRNLDARADDFETGLSSTSFRASPAPHTHCAPPSWAPFNTLRGLFSSFACSLTDSKKSDVPQYNTHNEEVARLCYLIRKEDWGRAMNALENFPVRLTAMHVVDVIKLETNPKYALRFFIWAGHQEGYVHNAFATNAITRVWGHENDFKAFLDILGNMHLEDYSMTPAKYLILIKGYGWAGLPDVAVDILEWMIKTGRRPNERHFSCLLDALLKEQQFQKAESILEKMKQVGVQRDVVTYTTLIDGSCKGGHVQVALNYFSEMFKNGIRPNAFTYTTLFDGLCKLGEIDKALKAFEDIKDIELDTVALNTLMSGLCSYDYVEKAHGLFLSAEIKPDARTYAILVGGLCKVKNFKDARKFVDEAIAKGFVFEVAACTALLESLCMESKGKEACDLIYSLLSHGNIPDATCNMVVASLSRSGEAYSAYKLWYDILRYKSLSGDTYEALLDGLCKEGRLTFSKRVYDDMISKGFAPTVDVQGALLDGFCRAGNFDGAWKILDELVERGGSPNVNIFNSLIHGLSKAGHISKAEQVLKKMEDAGCFPTLFTYVSLINGYCKVRSPEGALILLKRMFAQDLAPDVGTLSNLIQTYCKVKSVVAGYELFKVIKGRGYTLGVPVYDALIAGLCQAERIDDAHELLLELLGTSGKPDKVVSDAVVQGLRKLGRMDDVSKLVEVLG